MSKKLNLNSFAAARTLRSGKRYVTTESSEETSPYFVGEQSTSAKTDAKKKRPPIKIKYEPKEKKVSIECDESVISDRYIKCEIADELVDKKTVKIEKPEIKSENIEQSMDITNIKIEKNDIVEDLIDSEHIKNEIKIKYEPQEEKVSIECTESVISDSYIKSEIADEPVDKKTVKIEKPEIKSENIEQSMDVTNIKIKKNDIVEDLIDSEHIKNEQQSQWMPPNWEIILENIKEMRKENTAPVDKMGCHKCADPNASPVISRYQSLVALMLSSQTKDQITYAAMKRLHIHGCKPDIIAQTPDDVLGKLIYPVGFWKRKVIYIKKTSVILLDKYNGDIPRTIEGLCDLPGVGPKMAHICMQIAWGEVSGIGVDTHVHRISNRLGWVRRSTKIPEQTRNELEDWLPKSLWSSVNHLLVGFGQEICLPQYPKCTECLNKDICPFVRKTGKVKK